MDLMHKGVRLHGHEWVTSAAKSSALEEALYKAAVYRATGS